MSRHPTRAYRILISRQTPKLESIQNIQDYRTSPSRYSQKKVYMVQAQV